MKKLFLLFFGLACVLLGGCVSPDFAPYVGKQGWPQGTGCAVETNYIVPIYHGWPDKPYTVLGVVTMSGIHPAAVTRYAKSKGADALIFRTILTGDAGSYTTPGHATSFTSGSYYNDQYSGFTTTTYSPSVTIPLTVTVSVYDAIKWEDPLQVKADILRNTLDWANAHPDGGNYVDGTDTNYFNAEEVRLMKSSLQDELDDLLNPSQAKVDALRETLDWLNANPDGGTMGEGQSSTFYNAEQISEAKTAIQEQLDDLQSALNQSAKTNASTNVVTSLPILAQIPQTNAPELLDSETLKSTAVAAENGDVFSQMMLAIIYRKGIGGVQKDSTTAAYWYLRAAKQGDDGSQFSVGEMYEKGEGVMQDFVEAYKWYNIAAVAPDIDWNAATNFFKTNGIDIETLNKFKASWIPVAEEAKAARDQLARQMTTEQIAEGQRRSAAFVPRRETPISNSQSASPAAADFPLRFTPPSVNTNDPLGLFDKKP
jgi:TPR repeat protein